jgi:hypothetical protein
MHGRSMQAIEQGTEMLCPNVLSHGHLLAVSTYCQQAVRVELHHAAIHSPAGTRAPRQSGPLINSACSSPPWLKIMLMLMDSEVLVAGWWLPQTASTPTSQQSLSRSAWTRSASPPRPWHQIRGSALCSACQQPKMGAN